MKIGNPNNPLEGITLEMMLTELVDKYGWYELSLDININCFKSNPSIKSSLTFLRRTPWARAKVEDLFRWHLRKLESDESE
ncbi:MAG: VF530 family protein [Proteobacteria bacterium]|nr:VF530 family protein [Pseudomonadota bacterium]